MVGTRSTELDYSIDQAMTHAQQIRYLQLFNHVVFLGGLLFAVISNQFWLIYLSIAVGLFFGVIGINIGFHRYLTHKSFETYPIIDKFLLVVGTLCLVGTPVSWTISHINHHAYADTEGDPYSPSRLTLWNFLMTRFEPIKHPRLGAKTVFRNSTAMWLHEHYFLTIGLYCLVLAVVNPLLVIYCWAIPSLLALYILLVTNIVCHLYGYRNHDTKDKSHNNIFISIITLGEGWHNNHHADPSQWDQKLKWWELDPTSWIIKLIKK